MKKQLILVALLTTVCSVANAQFWKYSDPAKLGGSVNTPAEESIPVFSRDSSLLYFVRTFDASNTGGETDQDIWYSERGETGAYGECARLKSLDNKFNNAVVGLGDNGSTMYLLNSYDGKKDQAKGIAVSYGDGTKWSKPEKLDIPGLDIEGDFYGFHVVEGGDVIIISYNGTGSMGEEDLYVTTKTGGSWSAPMHMGSSINSTGFEISPFLSRTGDTLFFSSNGFGGEGDADIFYSVKQGSWTSWSAPVNLGNKINSPKFDAYFVYAEDQAYWSSNREDERSDIYMIDILTPPPLVIACTSTDATIYKGADGSIDLTVESGADGYSYDWSNGQTAEDAMGLVKGEYTVTVTDGVGQVATATCSVDEPAMPIDAVDVVDYANLDFKHNFGYNKNKISVKKGPLKKFIKEIEEQLKDGRENITIQIVSSASQVPTKTFGTNESLAEVRAENMKYDLVAYFENKYAGRVTVVIVETKVDGPAYEDDSSARDKYEPYQFVSLKTE
ncbi:MAG: SprB repeat-containing protein [Crocinitomicaceae bacterium]|nr:SprB repeat-containing protein [Crocinitomicaceae bacterium]